MSVAEIIAKLKAEELHSNEIYAEESKKRQHEEEIAKSLAQQKTKEIIEESGVLNILQKTKDDLLPHGEIHYGGSGAFLTWGGGDIRYIGVKVNLEDETIQVLGSPRRFQKSEWKNAAEIEGEIANAYLYPAQRFEPDDYSGSIS